MAAMPSFAALRRIRPRANAADAAASAVARVDGCIVPRRRPRAARRSHRIAGTTLIEAMIVVVVIGILLSTAVPSFAAFLASQRVSAASNDLLHAIAVTRSEALRRGRRVYLAPLGAHWRDGWAVFVDHDDDRRFDAAHDELILAHGALPASTTITNPSNPAREPFTDVGKPERTYLMFDGVGYPRQRNGAFSVGSLAVADHGAKTPVWRTLCVGSYGRVRVVAKPSC